MILDKSLNRTDLKCTGFAIHNVSLTAYYPVFETDDTRDYLDDQGDELKTLQVRKRNRRNVAKLTYHSL